MITPELLIKIQTNTEEVVRQFQGLLLETEQVSKQLKILDEREKTILKKDQDLSANIVLLSNKQEAFQGDKDALQKKFTELVALEDRLNKRQQALDQQIKKHMGESIEKEKELASRDEITRIKEKELDGLWEREKTVKAQLEEIALEKQMIEREKRIDRERKIQLDSREEKITVREERMQRLISS